MEIAPLINNAVAVVTASAAVAASANASASASVTRSSSSSKENDNVNNLALLASLTLQKVLNINNNNSQHSNNNHNHSSDIKKHEQQKQQQPQRRNLDIKSENDVLNQLLKNGAVFTKTVTPTAPIAIETKKKQTPHQQQQQQQHQNAQQQQQQQCSAQKQRLNSSISSTHSSISTNSSYGSSSSEDATLAASAALSKLTPRTNTTKASNIKLPEKSKIPSDILDDLASRFIINVPDMELNNLIRMCFQIELAHWFYLDFFCAPEAGVDAETPKCVQRKLPTVGIKQFAMQLFQHIPFLNKYFGTVDQILEEWKNYKLSVPTYGAILVSEDHNHCLLVQSYFARNSWGFPKGKINENEDPAHCATREVYEETGFDITDTIDANDYIEAFINYQYTRLYVVRNIPLDTQFAPRTRNEIKCCEWFRIDALPVNKNDAISKAKLGKNSNSFFMIMPFVKRLKKWVGERKAGIEPRRRKCSGQQSPPKAGSPTNINGSCKKDAAKLRNDSRRQRHKSMGDLDGVKLNNLNGKVVIAQPGAGGSAAAAPASATAAINPMNICNSNGKRNKQNAAAGSNQTTPLTTATAAMPNGSGGGSTISSKRQLFHSQSQNDAQQSASNEKIVSSFDLIRKEKQQQLKAAKAQKQQQQQQQQQRLRTMSQSEKPCNPQQPIKILGQQQSTTSVDIIAMLSAAAAAQKTPKNEQQQQPQQQQQQQRPRPASVSLNFGAGSAAGATPTAPDAQDMHKLQRMASGTNLRILKRAQSQQPPQQQQLQQQQLQHQQQQLGTDFTPNFNSWTNFSFTKNFIANVFC
ncbi:m7GpppN-mRNA hydrolase dcap-2 isoform X2 [Drosophila ficusphila]|uniref:m7GpppN-mRNA hydrolase dcap-2 isoform X2 n=1 Tax=Drosophila ficusphila TaxID=30025 RepID=UPI0007E6B75A|nr:m7GpppN-mRNA hydrolase dcap-2 isoform X2 [Drosophila ficusphila]